MYRRNNLIHQHQLKELAIGHGLKFWKDTAKDRSPKWLNLSLKQMITPVQMSLLIQAVIHKLDHLALPRNQAQSELSSTQHPVLTKRIVIKKRSRILQQYEWPATGKFLLTVEDSRRHGLLKGTLVA